MPYLIANAKVNNRTESLNYKVYRPKLVEFVDISSQSGMRAYVRSLCFILAKAVNDICLMPLPILNMQFPKDTFFI